MNATPAAHDGAGRWPGALALMLASGFAGLGYQIVWTQQCALWLGHESAAVLAVVAAFFGGLALGAGVMGGRLARSAFPARWYAACEWLIGAWSLALAGLLGPLSGWLVQLLGAEPSPLAQWTLYFGGTFLLLLPATAAMGATLPAMQTVVPRLPGAQSSIALLYAVNTAGAMLGVLVVAFVLIPQVGLRATTLTCATLNLLCGTLAWNLLGTRGPAPVDPPSTRTAFLPWRLAVTGLLGIGYEVLVVRVLSEVAEDTVYTFALLLAVYLAAGAAGAAVYQRWTWRRVPVERDDAGWFAWTAVACSAGTATLWGAESIKALVLRAVGDGFGAAIAAEATLALIAFGAPALFMGALFAHLSTRARAEHVSFGAALTANTLGAAMAPLVFGVLAVGLLGAKAGLLMVCAGYLLLALLQARTPWTLGLAAVIGAAGIWAPPLIFIDVPAGGRVLSYRSGALAAVSVTEDANGIARLRINNRQQEGASAPSRVDGRQGVLPVLLHPAPRRALFLGVGTGVTSATAAQDPRLDVQAVDLLPEVLQATTYFANARPDDAPLGKPRFHAADARRFVRVGADRFDVIVADNFHPARSGSGSLYTVEHFSAVRARLSPTGVFCQWLPLHQLDLDTLRSIVRSYMNAFPDATAMLASNSLETPVIGLVGRADGGRFDAAALAQRLDQVPAWPVGLGFEDIYALLGGFIAGPAALRAFAGDSPLNTDDRPVVTYRAPRVTYAPDSAPAERLQALLASVSIQPADLIAASAQPDLAPRLAAYWSARRPFIDAGARVQPSSDVHAMLAQVREPLLGVLRISPDFRPAYDPLLRMGMSLARSDHDGAVALLTQLAQLQPQRLEAADALGLLSAR